MTTRPITILVDDTRDFKDGRPALVARTSAHALGLVRGLQGRAISGLWLDYNLVDGDTTQPVVDHLVALARAGVPAPVSRIYVHSSNVTEGFRIRASLADAGYKAARTYAVGLFVRARYSWPPEPPKLPEDC